MDDEQLKIIVLQNASCEGNQKKFACERAHQMAAELGVEVRRIGEICIAERIKIIHCQLGCFGDRHG